MQNRLKGLSDKNREEIVAVAETIENNGQLLRKVDRKPKAGDYVRFSGLRRGLDTKNGKFYKVLDGDSYVNDTGGIPSIYGWRGYCTSPEIFEVVGNNMVSLNEIASLVQQIKSHMDDSENDVFIVDIDTCNSQVQMKHIAFLVEFVEFEIRFTKYKQFPYKLSSTIGGVKFVTFMKASEIVDLKTTIPDQFDYITAKVQMDIEGR